MNSLEFIKTPFRVMPIRIARDIYERVYSSHWFLTCYNGIGFVRDSKNVGAGDFISEIIYILNSGDCSYVYRMDEFEKAAKYASLKLLNDKKWRRGIYAKIAHFSKLYFTLGERLRKADLRSFSDRELVVFIRKIIHAQHWHQAYSVLVNGIVIDGRNHLSDLIISKLRKHIKDGKKFTEHWSCLSLPTKMSLRQKKEYQLALLSRKVGYLGRGGMMKKLAELHARYCWLDYNNLGPAAKLEEYVAELENKKLILQNINIKSRLLKIAARQKWLEKKLGLNREAKALLRLARLVIEQKAYRKDVQYHGFYCFEFLLREIARRRGLSEWKNLFYLFPWELERFLMVGTPKVSELKQRQRFSCLVVKKRYLKILAGDKAKKFVRSLRLERGFKTKEQAQGQCAFAGRAIGRVRLVQRPIDMRKMNQGDILLSQATSPDLLPAIRKAAAIVTNTGGLICHAAITARELEIPCVVGTGNATLIFSDGDMVEVDALNGIIRKMYV